MKTGINELFSNLEKRERILALFAVAIDGLEAPNILLNDVASNLSTLELVEELNKLPPVERLSLIGTLLRKYNDLHE
ncbi:MAG: hypothetical protein NZT61_05175 [Deltaproteobacteria bacterium]|nr:hypothetical protein [Deltaproteobacteria bacterium]MCX7952719.1 hypothetical protein [Deltaproteobacteria bacterium]